MTPMKASREFDLILFGATGFTGGLAADYLAHNAPAELRWALAGRTERKLEAVRARLATVNPGCADLPLVFADANDPAALGDAARRTRLVISTVGPYLQYGGPLVAACAEAGTDYVDVTGEPEFVDRMWLAHHETAQRTGARLVHSCGFDSVPHDLGALFAVGHLSPDAPITMRGVVRSNGTFSGGTFHTALTAMSRAGQEREAASARRRATKQDGERSSRAVSARPQRDPLLGYYLLPLPTIDPLVVAHSGEALPAYGPHFRYSHFAGTKTMRYAAGGVAGAGALGLAAQIKPLREMLLGKVPQGEGPDVRRREKSWFTVDFVGVGDGRTVHTRVSGGDPGYTETAKMLAESALCLLLDDNPETAGQVTTAVAMGEHLTDRLLRAGIGFEVVN
jgi:saccharopine dehydrogenase (NAD+, L-glutamate forming)